jgi:hypothetical protein
VGPCLHCDRAGIQTLIASRAAGAALVLAVAGCAPHPRVSLAPHGGGSDCVVADTSAATDDTIYVVGTVQSPLYTMASECIRVATVRGVVVVSESPSPDADLRDILDRGLPAAHMPRPDVVVTHDPNVLSYAARRPEYLTVVLPYDRTYLLVSADSSAFIPSQVERDALARDAVTADARGAAEPFEWLSDSTCFAPRVSTPASPRRVVAYTAGDAIARQLAERIVALSGTRTRSWWLPPTVNAGETALRVAPLAPDSIRVALATGRIVAAVEPVARFPRTHCGTSMGWVPWGSVPLVDSRAHAIVRLGSGAAFVVNDDGTLHFVRRPRP